MFHKSIHTILNSYLGMNHVDACQKDLNFGQKPLSQYVFFYITVCIFGVWFECRIWNTVVVLFIIKCFLWIFQVLVSDPEKLEAIRARELDITKERLQKILATGVNVILCTGGIDDLCLKYFIEAGAMGVRRCKKADLKRIAKATGASFLTSLTNMDGKY